MPETIKQYFRFRLMLLLRPKNEEKLKSFVASAVGLILDWDRSTIRVNCESVLSFSVLQRLRQALQCVLATI